MLPLLLDRLKEYLLRLARCFWRLEDDGWCRWEVGGDIRDVGTVGSN